MNPKPTEAVAVNWLGRLIRRYLFARGYALIPVHDIEWLEASALANHCAQKKHPQDSWNRGYFNGLADQASKTAYKLKRYYPHEKP